MESEEFVEREADEEEDDSSSSSGSSSSSSDDSEEDEEEEEGGQEDLKDLIDDSAETESVGEGEREGSGEEEGSDVEGRRKKRRKRPIDDQLEDEDYALIAENTGIQIQRKKFRRVRELDSDEEEAGGTEGGGGEELGASASQEMEALTHEVFGDSDEEELPDVHISEGRPQAEKSARAEEEGSGESGDEDEFDDFLVGPDGKPMPRKRSNYLYDTNLMEAQDIFGLDFDPTEFEQVAREGLDSEGEEEDDEIPSDEEEKQFLRIRKLRRAKKARSIYDVYEPSELESGHFTERDLEIRVSDIPERFQVRVIPVQSTEEGELDEEAEWLYQQAFCKPPISKQPFSYPESQQSGAAPRGGMYGKPQSAIPKIREALNFMRNHSFEVPFIANYRREYVEPELNIYDLWKVWQWDEKWMQLRDRKQQMVHLFERMRDYQFEKVREQPDTSLTEDMRTLQTTDFVRLEQVQSSEELGDVYAHFLLYYGRDLVAMRNKRASRSGTGEGREEKDEGDLPGKERKATKQAIKKDFFAACQEIGLGALVARFGLTAEQFGENLRDNYQRHDTEQHDVEPEEAAEDFLQPSGFFTSVRAVLQGVCHMVAMEIACEPLVRQTLRQVFQTRGLLGVNPTRKGFKMIDEAHPCWPLKYLRNKPVRDIKGDEFLHLFQAEDDRLLEMKITIDYDHGADKRSAGSQHTYFEEIRQLFYRDDFSLLVEKWNAQRAQAVAQALHKVLYPLMEKELRVKLVAEAKDHVLQSCVSTFRSWIDVSPFPCKREDDSYNQSEEPYARVVACAFTSDRSVPAFCCFADGSGEVVDFRRLTNLLKRKNSPFEREREQKEDDLRSFKRFIESKRPDIVVVSAESRDAQNIVEDFNGCLSELESEEAISIIPVELMDPNLARIYAKSKKGEEEFPDYPELLRMAVSLARRIQEPLHQFCSLTLSENCEALSLSMHSLQASLAQDVLKLALEIELVTKVNEVGVDANFCLEHPHTADLLPFVCGLGPRKAASLIKILKQENAHLQNRSQLVTQCSIGPQVFINCASFIKIDTSAFSDVDSTYIDVLDSTRVHPETYEWARKMAVDALEYDETGDDSNPSAVVEEILLTPDKLRDLDLDAFADELERQDYGNKRTTLYTIRDELFGPFKERRRTYTPLSLEQKFCLLTGETLESLKEGKVVTCTVVGVVRRKPTREQLDHANPIRIEMTGYWQCPFCQKADFRDVGLVWQHFDDGSCPGQGIGVRTRLENGINGFILTRNISDKQVNSPEERVHIGMTIHCRILRISLERLSVDLTCRSSDLADKDGRFGMAKDMYYDQSAEDADKKKEDASLKPSAPKYFSRVIAHPSFKNASFEDAETELASLDQGDAIFRPSRKGTDHLTVTWKLDKGIHQHVDIKEQEKPNQYSLGKVLVIGEEKYEDLDEILARFVQPMAALVRDLLANRWYRPANGGDTDMLKKILREEKERNPKRIPYFFSALRKVPGKFLLGYQPSHDPKVEYISITPDGFRYRNKIHRTVEELVKWFKEHYRDPIPRPIPTTTSLQSQVVAASHRVDPSLLPHLQAAVNTAHGRLGTGGTPYTPSQWAHATPTSYGANPPTYPQQQYGGSFGGGSVARGGVAGAGVAGRGGYQGGGQYGTSQFGGQSGFQPPGGRGWGSNVVGWGGSQHTPMQTPGRTPAYTPTQTPHSFTGSAHSTPNQFGGVPRGYHVRSKRVVSPMSTPVQDE